MALAMDSATTLDVRQGRFGHLLGMTGLGRTFLALSRTRTSSRIRTACGKHHACRMGCD
jgi:hypothetical protein